jgi:hypothetical protein
MSHRNNTIDWMFRNRETGKLTLGQPANIEGKIFASTAIVGTLLPPSKLRTGVGIVSVLALAVWGVDELARGVNPYRRISGGVALAGLVWLALRRSQT